MSNEEKNAILSLLSDVKPNIDKIHMEEEAKREKGETFNIFSVLGIQRREVYFCRMIGELLSPQGSHGLGSLFIKSFFRKRKFALLNIADSELENAIVTCEDSTGEGKRIDLTVQTASWIIPIEAKIDADDQPNQCADYALEIENRAKIYGKKASDVFYLTLDGRRPSPLSMINSKGLPLDDSRVKTLTWKEDILPWLEECYGLDAVGQRDVVKINIHQLVYIMKGWYRVDNDFEKIISENNFLTAMKLWQIIDNERNNLWNNFIKDVKQKMSSHLVEIPKKPYEYWYKRSIVTSDESINIGMSLQNRGRDTQGIVFYLIVADGRFEGQKYYLDRKYTSAQFRDTLSEYVRNEMSRQQKSLELPWLYREDFPPYKKGKINFSDFSGGTESLLLKENLKSYVDEIFIPWLLKLTGWNN